MILATVQPTYLAWLPLFKRIQMADVYVHLDDVEFSKNSTHNRNRIKTPQGPLMLTVPVLYTGNSKAFISEIGVDNSKPWAKKHWRAIEMNYRGAPFFDDLEAMLSRTYAREWEMLGDLSITIIDGLCDYLGVDTPRHRSSDLAVAGEGNEKLVNICKSLDADKFVVKPGTEHYHPGEFFAERGVTFEYFEFEQPAYPQLFGDFAPNMSALDYAMNCGPGSLQQ